MKTTDTEKKIAQLDVVIDTDPECPASRLESMDIGPGNYKLRMCPNAQNGKQPLERSNFIQIMAHELGHFIANLLGTDEAKKRALAWQHDIPHPMEPTEREAWDIAEEIVPGAKRSEAYKFSMRGYRGH